MYKINSSAGISRRSFLQGSVIASAAAATMGIMGCAPSGEAEEAAVDESEAGGAQDAGAATSGGFPSSEVFEEMQPPVEGEVAFVADPIDEADVADIVDVDVVVCGAGWAGCCAATAAAEGGASVVLLQKGDAIACNGGEIAAFGDKVHEHYDEIIDPEQYISDLMYTANFRIDENVVRRFVAKSGEAMDWLMGIVEDKVAYPELSLQKHDVRGGIDWYSSAVSFNGGGGVMALSPLLLEYAASVGDIDVRYNTPACQLVQDENGAIVGVIAKAEDGTYVKFNTAKGVILATGGYEFNWERLKKCIRPRDLAVRAYVNGCVGNTGDGHEMGLAVGGMEDEYPHCFVNDPSGTLSGVAFGAAIHPFLRVNDFGVRFVNEAIPSNFLANAVSSQPGAHDWVIADSKMATDMEKIRDLVIPGTTPESEAETFMKDSETADTLEELAEKMGVNPDAFVASVERYNELCAKGDDEDFHKPADKLSDVTQPPFYACNEGQILLATENGLVVNSDAAVMNGQTKMPIPGLYAVGTCAGSMFHDTYPHHCSGISLGRALTYGWIAGRILSGVDEPVNK